jgi:peroxiredoxin
MSRHIFALGLLFALLLAGAAQAAQKAADFELKDTAGKSVELSDLLDDSKLLLIDFWQVGCKPCNELVAHLQDYYDEYQEDGLEVVIISRDTALTVGQVAPYFKSNDYSFRILLDTDLEVSKDYGVKASPATFIIQPDGTLLYRHFAYKTGQEKEIEQVIKDFLAGKEVDADLESAPK